MAKVIERYESDAVTPASASYDEGVVVDGAATTPRRDWWKNASTAAETFASCKFEIQQVGANDGDDFAQMAPDVPFAAPGAPNAAAVAGAGLEIGDYNYKITFVSANGQTTPGTVRLVTTTPGNQQVDLSAIPVGPAGITARKIYRTIVGGAGDFKLVATIPDNVTTIYSDTTPDAGLGVVAPTLNTSGVPGAWVITDIVIGDVVVGSYVACWMRFNVPAGTSQVGNPRTVDIAFVETGV